MGIMADKESDHVDHKRSDKELIWQAAKDASFAYIQLFPEARFEVAQRMLEGYKKLYPEKFQGEDANSKTPD